MHNYSNNDCARLVTNCIFYYNAALISTLIDRFRQRKHQKAVDMIARLSPVAWSHIQLVGHYIFDGQKITLDLESMLVDVDPSTEDFNEMKAA